MNHTWFAIVLNIKFLKIKNLNEKASSKKNNKFPITSLLWRLKQLKKKKGYKYLLL